MEKVLLNPGYHHITEKILNSLNFQSRFSLSQTNKEIMKVCERFMIAKGRKTSIFEVTKIATWKCYSCVDQFVNLFQNLETIVKDNDIYYFRYFTFIEPKSPKEQVLLQFVQNLAKVTDAISKFSLKNENLATHFDKIVHAQVITLKYARFIPPNCPMESSKHLKRLLYVAIRWKKLEMAKTLLAAMKNQDTCLRLTISAMSSNSYIIYKNDMTFIEKIATKCKNPNAPNKSGSTVMHLVAKLGLDKIAMILLPYCKNLGQRDQDKKTALDIAIENGNYETMTIIKDAIVRRALSI